MRYQVVVLCFLSVLLLAACADDDRDGPRISSVTAVAGQGIELDIGVASLRINAASIGNGAGQIAPGSRVSLAVTEAGLDDRNSFSPVVRARVRDSSGNDVSGLNLNPPAVFELSYDYGRALAEGLAENELALGRISGGTLTELDYALVSGAVDAEFIIPTTGRARARLTDLASFVVLEASAPAPLPDPVALTGTTSTVFTSTIFQLADAASEYAVNLAIPTAETTSVPATLGLTSATFNASNPLDPNNRLLTVQTGGSTYTSAQGSAAVTLELATFSGTGSSGTLTGTLVQQGGSATLPVNFTFTTGSTAGTAVAGTVTDAFGRRTMALSDAGGDETIVIVMPTSLPNAALDPITFNDASFDSGDPFDPDGRVVFVTVGDNVYTSDVPIVGNVTLTFASWDSVTRTGNGTISGTVISAEPATRSIEYNLTVTGGPETGGGELEPGTPFDVATSEVADAVALVHDGLSYIAVWLSSVGTANRTLELVDIDDDTFVLGTQRGLEPAVGLDPDAGLEAAVTPFGEMCIVGATGTGASDQIIAVFYDYDQDDFLAEVVVGTGTAPRVVYHADADTFVIAWQAGAAVQMRVFEYDGEPVGSVQTVFSTGTLAGMAPAEPDNEVLITESSGSGVRGRYVNPDTGGLTTAAFTIAADFGGGLCVWDPFNERYLVTVQQVAFGFFTLQQVVGIAPGTTSVSGDPLTLPALQPMTRAAGSINGVLYTDAASNLFGVDGLPGGPELIDLPAFSALTGFNGDVTGRGPAVASDGAAFLVLAALGPDGVAAMPVTLLP
jgi:hypothetical protein